MHFTINLVLQLNISTNNICKKYSISLRFTRKFVHVARMGQMRNSLKLQSEKTERKKPLNRPRLRWG